MTRVLAAVWTLIAVFQPPAVAHHATASEYDAQQKVTLKGRLVEVDWRNPHPAFYIELAAAGGPAAKWAVVTATPSMLVRFPGDWTRTKVLARLKDEVTVVGWKARDGSNRIYGDALTFSDGAQMKMGIGLTGG